MIITIENNAIYLDGNTAGSVEDALANFPTLSNELWVSLNTQVKELTTLVAQLTGANTALQEEVDSLKAVDPQASEIIEVPMWKARLQLHNAGYLAIIEAVVHQLGFEVETRWNFVPTLKEDNTLVNAVLDQITLPDGRIGLTPEEKHQLFVDARQII